MSTKVAQVKILLDEEVRSLDDHERMDRRLTGGHLSAQMGRFENLWHVFFSCEEQALEDIRERDLYPLLIDAIDCFVLGLDQGPVTPSDRALTIARSLATAPGSPWQGRDVVDDLAVAHRGHPISHYPSDLPAIRHLYRQ